MEKTRNIFVHKLSRGTWFLCLSVPQNYFGLFLRNNIYDLSSDEDVLLLTVT